MRSSLTGLTISMRTIFALVAVAATLFFVGIKISAAAPPICLDPKGHLVWPGQSASVIPMRSVGTADTLTNSPLSVSGGIVAISTGLNVAGDINATGNVTGSNICVGASCISNWSQVSGSWTQSGSNLFPNNLSWNIGIGTNAPTVKLDVNGDIRAANLTLSCNLTNNVLRLVPGSAPASPQQGMMYYDSVGQAFKCYQKDPNDGIVKWMTCGGGQSGGLPSQGGFPFQIKDNNGNLVLEVNQE